MHLGTVSKTFLASIFHNEKLCSAWVQLGFSVVQPAEPKLNPTHELVCDLDFLNFLYYLFYYSFRANVLCKILCKFLKSCTFHF